jgi:hypothetical protein
MARMGGWDSVQGHAEAIRGASAAGQGAAMAGVGHGAGAARSCVRSRWGKKERQGEEIRSDGWGPLVSETKSGRWAGGLVG